MRLDETNRYQPRRVSIICSCFWRNKQWLYCRKWQFLIAYMIQKWPSWCIKLGIANFYFCIYIDDYLWKSYVFRTTFSNVKYQDLCATINPSKIKYISTSEECVKHPITGANTQLMIDKISLLWGMFWFGPGLFLLNKNFLKIRLKFNFWSHWKLLWSRYRDQSRRLRNAVLMDHAILRVITHPPTMIVRRHYLVTSNYIRCW